MQTRGIYITEYDLGRLQKLWKQWKVVTEKPPLYREAGEELDRPTLWTSSISTDVITMNSTVRLQDLIERRIDLQTVFRNCECGLKCDLRLAPSARRFLVTEKVTLSMGGAAEYGGLSPGGHVQPERAGTFNRSRWERRKMLPILRDTGDLAGVKRKCPSVAEIKLYPKQSTQSVSANPNSASQTFRPIGMVAPERWSG